MKDIQRKAMFSKFTKSQRDLLIELEKPNPVISKNETQMVKNALNNDREFGNIARNIIAHKNDNDGGVKIDNAYKRQGLSWLKKQRELAWRERNAVENNTDFRLTGFRNINYHGGKNFTPCFSVEAKDSSFDYNYNNGKVDISG